MKKYSETAGQFESVNAPVFKTHEQALQQLDRTGGGSNLTVNDVFVQVNTTEDEWGDSSRNTGELIDYVAFRRAVGVGSNTNIVSNKITTKTSAITATGTVQMAETIVSGATQTNSTSNLLNVKTVTISGTDADDVVAGIAAAGFDHVSAS